MRLMVNSQPSGVVRRQEIRVIRPFSSDLWHPPQALWTASLVMGIPESSSSFSFSVGSLGAGVGVCPGRHVSSASAIAHPDSNRIVGDIIQSSMKRHGKTGGVLMQVSIEDLRRHYASLSDEALEEIDPDELTEVARQCYQREVDQRGLLEPASEPVPDRDEVLHEDFDVEPDWLEHAACPCSYTATPGSNHAPDAARAHDVLVAAGVPCYLSLVSPDPGNEDSSRFDEYRVLVPESLNLKAISVLDREIFNPEMEDDWRNHFAALSDDELRPLKPEVICAGLLDRVARLTRIYNEEIARRK